MFNPKTQYAKIAFDTILFYITTGQIRKIEEIKITPDLKLNLGCIAYIFDSKNSLISFFGNVYPQKISLYEEIVSNAITAVDSSKKRDLIKENISNILVYVDVLSLPQKVEDINDINPQKQGVFIKDKNGRSSFVLPNVKGIKTGADQIKLAKKQAGFENINDLEIDIMSFKVTRYE